MGRAGGLRHLFNKVFQPRRRKETAQREARIAAPLVTPLFSSALTGFPSRIAFSAILEVEHVLVERVEIERPVQDMLADNVRVNLPVALDDRIGQAQRH
jgi:hypothetical protein